MLGEVFALTTNTYTRILYTLEFSKHFMSPSFKTVKFSESKPQFCVSNVFCVTISFECSESSPLNPSTLLTLESYYFHSKVGKPNFTRFLLFVRFYTVKNQQI